MDAAKSVVVAPSVCVAKNGSWITIDKAQTTKNAIVHATCGFPKPNCQRVKWSAQYSVKHTAGPITTKPPTSRTAGRVR